MDFRRYQFLTKKSLILFILLIILNIQKTQQQKRTKLQKQSKELAYCLASDTTEHNIRSFWQSASSDCPNDPQKLLDLYEMQNRKKENSNGKCNHLVKHQLRKTLIETCSIIYEDAIISKTFHNNNEIGQLSTRIAKIDQHLLQIIWEQTIDAIYLYVDINDLAQIINEIDNFEIKVKSLIYLRHKQIWRSEQNMKLLIKISTLLNALQNDEKFHKIPFEIQRQVLKLYAALPKQLILLYTATENPIRLLNKAHWEYLYAPRDNGPDEVRRIPLTWIKEKNSTDSDGDFILESRGDDGAFAIGNYYGGKLKYLYIDVEKREPYFLLKDDNEASQLLRKWWYIDWLEIGNYYILTNAVSGKILCAVNEYDENRRYVRVLTPDRENEFCHWFIISRQ